MACLAPVAQWIEYWPPKPGVAGSIPAGRAILLGIALDGLVGANLHIRLLKGYPQGRYKRDGGGFVAMNAQTVCDDVNTAAVNRDQVAFFDHAKHMGNRLGLVGD